MIIACPECVGPFEVRDGDIAELVQLECPHCRFRMILDFAAANDASLVEAGMRMASGFRSAADYRRAAGTTGIRVAEPAATPVIEPAAAQLVQPAADMVQLADDVVEPEDDVIEVAVEPVSEPVPAVAARVASAPTAVPIAPPSIARPIIPIGLDDDDDASETIVRTPAVGRPTVVGMAPPPARTEPTVRVAADTDTEPARSRSDALAQAGVPEPIDLPPSSPPSSPSPVASSPAPAREPATTPAAAAPRPTRGRLEAPAPLPEEAEPEPRRSGALGTGLLMFLLLLAVGLTAASIVRKNTPDPRPLLEDLYRQYVAP